ncbi:hypothetical protein ACHAWF_005455 [Thalassiosira exigua]
MGKTIWNTILRLTPDDLALRSYQVAIPPVGAHAFGWNPVQISDILAAQAVVIFLGMVLAMALSMTRIPDLAMLVAGQLCFVVGGIMTYYFWTTDSSPRLFAAPIALISLAYPFIGPANRSKYTKGVHARPELENSHGVLQSLLNQAFMIGGLVCPNFVATFVLRTPEEVERSGSRFELSPWAWYIPVTSTLAILGLIYEEFVLGNNELGLLDKGGKEEDEVDEGPATEKTSLVVAGKRKSSRKRRKSSIVEINQNFSAQYEVDRRSSVEAGGIINPVETRDEMQLRDTLLEDKKAWDELAKLDAMMEEMEEED